MHVQWHELHMSRSTHTQHGRVCASTASATHHTLSAHSQDLSDLTNNSYWPPNAFQRTASELSEPMDPDDVELDGPTSPKRTSAFDDVVDDVIV